MLRLSLADTKLLATIRQLRTLYPFADVGSDDTLCFLEDMFGPDTGDALSTMNRSYRAGWHSSMWKIAQRLRPHYSRLEREFGSYCWNLLGFLARAVTVTEKWVGPHPPVPFKKGE